MDERGLIALHVMSNRYGGEEDVRKVLIEPSLNILVLSCIFW